MFKAGSCATQGYTPKNDIETYIVALEDMRMMFLFNGVSFQLEVVFSFSRSNLKVTTQDMKALKRQETSPTTSDHLKTKKYLRKSLAKVFSWDVGFVGIQDDIFTACSAEKADLFRPWILRLNGWNPMAFWRNHTKPETNSKFAPENRSSQKDFHLPNHSFSEVFAVSFSTGYTLLQLNFVHLEKPQRHQMIPMFSLQLFHYDRFLELLLVEAGMKTSSA